MKNEKTIKCPSCGEVIDVNKILYHQLEDEFKQKNLQEKKRFDDEIAQKRVEYKKAIDSLKQKEDFIKAQQQKFDEELQKATKNALKQEKIKLTNELKQQIFEEQKESMELLKKELETKSNEVKELNLARANIEKLKREKEEIEAKIKADSELELSKKIALEKEKIQKNLQEQNELKFKTQQEQMEQLKKQLNEAQRKAEQGSQQLQGEVQELAIEEYLETKYPFDTIEEIKKGARGGDCIQIVHTREVQNCGKIYYESKGCFGK